MDKNFKIFFILCILLYTHCAETNKIRPVFVHTEQKQAFLKKYYSHHGFNEHNGIRVMDVEDGTSGVAARSRGRDMVTQDANIYFMRPGRNTETLTSRGRVLREGRHTAVCEAEVFTDDGTLIAKSTASVYFLSAD